MGLWVVCSNLAPGKSSPPSPLFFTSFTGRQTNLSELSRDSMSQVRGCHGTACPKYAAVTGQHVPSTQLSRDSMFRTWLSRDSMFRVRGCHGTACSEHAAVTGQHVPSTHCHGTACSEYVTVTGQHGHRLDPVEAYVAWRV